VRAQKLEWRAWQAAEARQGGQAKADGGGANQ
jgi:hypothetical protein